jgi:tetratricopeptide (TPR) repeat protein
MPSQKDIIKSECAIISIMIHKGNYNGAIQKLKILESKFTKSDILQLNKGGFLIDAGFGKKDEGIIKEGIKICNELLSKKLDKKLLSHLYYNMANGFMDLFQMYFDKSKELYQIPNNENLQNAKKHYRQSIKNLDFADSNLKKRLWTNYGNCLDVLGRNLEALFCYEKALKYDPKFAMALGNKAKAMKFFADISGVYRVPIYMEAYQMIKSVIEQNDLIQHGGSLAKESFELEIKKIESLFKDKKALLNKIKHKKYSESDLSDFEKFYLEFCSKYKLFLNFHIHDEQCEASIKDPVFISLITPLKDNKTFYNLAKHINQIKEDFAVARLLLVQSQFKREDFNRISKRTYLVYSLDYSMFNLYIGLLKSAFKEAYNILDKIAVFINDYYKIGIGTNKIYFDKRDFWHKEGKFREAFLDSKNISLYALYDIFIDFENKYYQKIKDFRNALTHRTLVIYNSSLTDWDKKENSTNIGYETMFHETVNLFRLVKSAVIYLINFVHLEERKKAKKAKGYIAPIYVDDYQFLED